MTVNIIYGSDGGATKAVAARIAKKLKGKAIDVAKATTQDFEDCELLILGTPTYGEGDLQSDWEDNFTVFKEANISGKTVALFGTGDQDNYATSFVNAMGTLYDQAVAKGANIVGFTATEGYRHTRSTAERDGQFVGLALDEDSEASKTPKRIEAWIAQLA
jgi:flavodoxin, long chain